jgi:hypothetical protein
MSTKLSAMKSRIRELQLKGDAITDCELAELTELSEAIGICGLLLTKEEK